MKKVNQLVLLLALTAFGYVHAQDLTQTQRFIKGGNSLREAHQYEKSENYLQQGLAGARKLQNKYWEAVADEYLGLLYSNTDDAAMAGQYFNKALMIYQGLNLMLSVNALKSMMSDRDITTSAKDNVWQYYGGVDIGSKGVKYSIIKMRRKEGHFKFEILQSGSQNPNIISFTPNAIIQTVEIVKAYFDTMTHYKEKIDTANIFIEVSSGVKQEADRRPGKEDELKAALTKGVSDYKKPIEFLDPCTEADLTIKGAVPPDYLYSSFLIDIGSGNTKGGFRRKDPKAPECISIPWGTASMANHARAAKSPVPQFFNDSVNNVIVTEIANKPALTNRKYGYLSGGIVWAMCNYLHPDKIKLDYTDFTLQDVNKFLTLATKDYDGLINPDLSSITESDELREAQKQIESSHNIFSKDEIISGALIVKNMLDEISKTGVRDKKFNFLRNGQIGWITGFIVKKVELDFNNRNE